MAKYDTYKLTIEVVNKNAKYNAELSVLIEDTDSVTAVLQNAGETLKTELARLKQSNFLTSIQ